MDDGVWGIFGQRGLANAGNFLEIDDMEPKLAPKKAPLKYQRS